MAIPRSITLGIGEIYRVFDAYCVASVWVRNGMFINVYNCLYYICMICYNLIKISSIIIPNLSPIGDFFGFSGFQETPKKALDLLGTILYSCP